MLRPKHRATHVASFIVYQMIFLPDAYELRKIHIFDVDNYSFVCVTREHIPFLGGPRRAPLTGRGQGCPRMYNSLITTRGHPLQETANGNKYQSAKIGVGSGLQRLIFAKRGR